tara:strand:+ start:396 stop:1175 length:780 start_codon:yes stop_codon:yes gene_type:complete
MKVIILAGGYGTRLSEYTEILPKPMVEIGKKPILIHLMEYYASYGHENFFLALGYKGDYIKKYFYDYDLLNSDILIDFQKGLVEKKIIKKINWKVNLINTGRDTMTGGRLKRLKDLIGNERFLLTYGDGLSNININSLIEFHQDHGKMVTVSAVRPSARFGEINIDGTKVINFKEKPQIQKGWINGGFFVIEPSFFDYIKNDETVLEAEPLENAAKDGELIAYKHDGFWQCMDTKRDQQILENLILNNKAPWLKYDKTF